MSRFELTRSALADIDELWTHIAEDNAEAADRVSSAILDACACWPTVRGWATLGLT